MKTISASSNGTDFIDDINDNFAECMTGVGSAELSLKMYGGQFDTSNGMPVWTAGITSVVPFLNYYHSRLVKVGSNTEISSAALENGEALVIFGYDANFAFVGHSSTLSIPNGSVYIRLQIGKSSAYTAPRTLECTFESAVEVIKDAHAKETMYKFFYESGISADTQAPTANLSNYYGVTGERHYDCGFIYLPTNYDPEGDPVPLILYCHGTSGFNWGTPQDRFDEFHKFCAYNGYAVADCCGVTDRYVLGSTRDSAFDIVNHYGTGVRNERGMCNPQLMMCINELYKYLTEVYNIKTDGVYLIGRSTGGKTAFLLPYMADFHVKAVAGLAPAVGLVTSLSVFYADENNYVLHRFGLKSRQVKDSLSGDGDKQYIIDNIEAFRGWDAMYVGSDIDMAGVVTAVFNQESSASFYENAKKINHFPSKIWISADDTAVPISGCRRYKTAVDNGNGLCIIRVLPDNAGQHFSMDDSPNAPRCNYTTKHKGVKNITIGYAETIDWFNQW